MYSNLSIINWFSSAQFVAVFSVLTCIVYGQLPGNRPSVAQSNAAKFSVDGLHYTDEQPQLQNQFVVAKIEFLEMTVADLALELRSSRIITDFFIKKQRETNRKVIYLANKLASKIVFFDLNWPSKLIDFDVRRKQWKKWKTNGQKQNHL